MNKQAVVIIFTCLYILGIIAFLLGLIFPFSILLLFCAVYLLFFNKLIASKRVFIFLFAFVFGIFNTALNIKYDDEFSSFSDSDITINAKVITIPSNSTRDRTKFYAKIKSAKQGSNELKTNNTKIFITINYHKCQSNYSPLRAFFFEIWFG